MFRMSQTKLRDRLSARRSAIGPTPLAHNLLAASKIFDVQTMADSLPPISDNASRRFVGQLKPVCMRDKSPVASAEAAMCAG